VGDWEINMVRIILILLLLVSCQRVDEEGRVVETRYLSLDNQTICDNKDITNIGVIFIDCYHPVFGFTKVIYNATNMIEIDFYETPELKE
jgi:hypothetical protein